MPMLQKSTHTTMSPRITHVTAGSEYPPQLGRIASPNIALTTRHAQARSETTRGVCQTQSQCYSAHMIEGVVVSPRRVIADDRGKVMHHLKATDPEFVKFGEIYFSTIF